MRTIIGTCHFVSIADAQNYYVNYGGEFRRNIAAVVERKIAEGEIYIGPPTLKPGERLGVIKGEGRYQITSGQDKPRAIHVHGRRWHQRSAGNTYCTAEIHVDGERVHKTERENGYDDYYIQAAGGWLGAAGYLEGREHYPQSGCDENLRHYCQRVGIIFTSSVSDVSREKNL